MEVDPGLVVGAGDLNVERGRQMFRAFWKRRTDVTAIVAYNDEIARGILEAAEPMGLRVPDELSVVGVDDMPWSAMLNPPLTTLRLPLPEMGEAAAGMLLRRMDRHFNGGEGERVCGGAESRRLAAELVVRGSTGPPAGDVASRPAEAAGRGRKGGAP